VIDGCPPGVSRVQQVLRTPKGVALEESIPPREIGVRTAPLTLHHAEGAKIIGLVDKLG
jgi:hypothetical protein